MNPLSERLITGTIGELIVQLRLFQFNVQAAPPLKDSGNDLIAVRGNTFRAIQVKTTGVVNGRWTTPGNQNYHVLALVRLNGEDNQLLLDQTSIYLINKELIDDGFNINEINDDYLICQNLVDQLIPEG